MLIQLVYCSKARHEITPQQTQDILSVSRKNNEAANITGCLCNNEQYFVQLLEGNYREVNDMYNTITGDDRHQKVTLLTYHSTKTRLFPNWSMEHISDDQYINDLLRKYVDNGSLLEIELFGQACIAYLKNSTR
ncbi:BLUF domain-containing protein [Chromatocurvus halotolerans]|uniref:FAD-dependent sensor of blue light n=1 Tax=Chromatocurvus halotolerans TaxID=1132028 RepID=A0A4R2KMA4_9GAMM|nr:BLUF domain-containing protein [Chromatocurvus halotolerans]TCO71856.1 FAD-dependent sensor of blue light [Chromatocurvus halotolerans]